MNAPAQNSKTKSILKLDDPAAAQPGIAGGKARNLAHMIQQDLPVPRGFVIRPTAFDGSALSPAATKDILSAVGDLVGGKSTNLAVRSSANVEDAADASYAGEFDTRLNIHGKSGLVEAIEAVYASRQSPRVIAYQAVTEGEKPVAMSVIVQTMVRAECGGVLFTRDPVRPTGKMVGNYTAGSGDAVVSGQVNPEIFSLDRETGQYAGPVDLKSYAQSLFELATRLERLFDAPQDIEWAVADGKVFILQTRPITTLQASTELSPDWNQSMLGDYLWVNTNFGEALPDVMTPLTWSMMQRYFGQITLGIESDQLPMGGNIGGRLYGNMTLFATLFRALGFSEAKLRAMASDAFGEIPDKVKIPVLALTRWQALRAFGPNIFKRIRVVSTQKKMLPEFVAKTPQRVRELRSQISSAGDAAQLADLWDQQLNDRVNLALGMLAAGTSDYKNLSRKLRSRLSDLVGAGDTHALMSGGTPGDDPLSSLGPLLGLTQLQTGAMGKSDYLEAYGHRGVSELELSQPTSGESDSMFAAQLSLASQNEMSPPTLLDERRDLHQAAAERLLAAEPSRGPKYLRQLERLEIAARMREATRSEVVRSLRLIRAYALKAAELLDLDDEVFYHSLDELRAALDARMVDKALLQSRRERHERLASLPAYPSIIRGRFNPFEWASDPDRRIDVFDPHLEPGTAPEGQINGFVGSPGIVEGRVRVLTDLSQAGQFRPGEILVASTTNIGWTPLFPRAAAIITDIGAPLSHAAIVARELGIPAVVGTGDATVRLKTGDQVKVFGGQGRIEFISRSQQ